ncbi:MotA/TolQ/ExbB proton channel family protein [Thiohalomonas denitrificans]|uniref:MotA/TolQ/ExbB proton channel family protein n=1 Tax=Thiohalomonas denitrificans TaxID=415747 RepID=UPI0026E9903F|nr:MotA/TolQ/ExbB proton channel family protein [Thiohalomonas denitrificans]
MRRLLVILLLAAFWPVPSQADGTAHLEELLHRIKAAEKRETPVRQQRLQQFLAEKSQQQQLLAQARQRLATERERSRRLKTTFESNEETLGELDTELKQRIGDLGEVFGTVRQTSKDLTQYVRESLVSVQNRGQAGWLHQLGESKALPETGELEKLWLLMQKQIVESGRVVRLPATVIDTGGVARQEPVIRVGVFNALDQRGRYLKFQPETGRLVVLPRQPSASVRKTAAKFANGSGGQSVEGHAEFALDPTRGTLLGMLVEAPDLMERIHHGGIVGYVIIALGALGALVASVRLTYLAWVDQRVRRQLRTLASASADNPLGRVLAVATRSRDADPANLELQIDEAVLRETPRLTRGEALVKLLAGVAPLLGLLGTVVGMIVTFQAISMFGTGDPKLMATGISQALVTTALGLIVAIPLLFMHSLLASRSRALIQILDEQSAGLIALGRETP